LKLRRQRFGAALVGVGHADDLDQGSGGMVQAKSLSDRALLEIVFVREVFIDDRDPASIRAVRDLELAPL
jgi:hypothetical protein